MAVQAASGRLDAFCAVIVCNLRSRFALVVGDRRGHLRATSYPFVAKMWAITIS